MRDQVQAIASAIGESIALEEVTIEQALRIAREYGGRTQQTAEIMLGFTALYLRSERPATPTTSSADRPPLPTIREILGQPARTFQEWAQNHVLEFRGTPIKPPPTA